MKNNKTNWNEIVEKKKGKAKTQKSKENKYIKIKEKGERHISIIVCCLSVSPFQDDSPPKKKEGAFGKNQNTQQNKKKKGEPIKE